MRLLACLAIVAFAVPGSASDPGRLRTLKRSPKFVAAFWMNNQPAEPRLLVDDHLLRTVLFPSHAASQWVMGRLGLLPDRTFHGNVIGLQVPGVPTPPVPLPNELR